MTPWQHQILPDETDLAVSTVLRKHHSVAWSVAKTWCTSGKVTVDGVRCLDPGRRLHLGAALGVRLDAPRTLANPNEVSLGRENLIHVDPHFAVVDKPPKINSVPYEPGEKGTLVDQVARVLTQSQLAPARAPLFVVHRLDRETSGVIVFGRTWLAKRHFAGLFRRHDLDREYLCLAHGVITAARTVESVIVEDRGDGLRGAPLHRDRKRSRGEDGGQRAVTHFRPVATLHREVPVSLVACTLETGRQHQIRIHLSEMGHPVVGERVYVRGYTGPRVDAPRVMLHARSLGFAHPARPDDTRVSFEAPLPEDFRAVAERLGWTPPETVR